MAIIELKDISKIYKIGKIKITALRNVSLSVKKGEFVAIMGPSGSGKTTLMNIIGLLDRPTSGAYFLNQKRVDQMKPKEQAKIRNQGIGFIFQLFNLLPRMSTFSNVMLPFTYSKNKLSYKEKKKRAFLLLKKVGLSHRINHFPNELSGGEKQRVAIARALVCNPLIILADEPTGTLDSKTSKEIMRIFRELNREGRTIIMVTHEKEIAEYAKRIIKLKDGRIVSS